MKMNELSAIWNKATVSPIFKKGKNQGASNSRPASFTYVLCKLLESRIRDGIIVHIESNGLVSKRQFGFMSEQAVSPTVLFWGPFIFCCGWH